MNESENYKIALLSGGLAQWREAIMPLLLAKSDCLTVAETLDELLSLPLSAKPEIIFVCHQPGKYDGIAAAEMIRALFALTPLVILAGENFDNFNAALKVGTLSVLEFPFSEKAFNSAFNCCSHIAQTLKLEMKGQMKNRHMSELFMKSPCCQMFVNADGIVTDTNHEAEKIVGSDTGCGREFSQISGSIFAPHSLTYPLELEEAVQSCGSWNGVLTGRLPDQTSRLYQIVCEPLTLSDDNAGVLVTLHDVTKIQADQAGLSIALQAARDCFALSGNSGTNVELQQMSSPECCIPLAEEVFSLTNLLESVMSSVGACAAETAIAIPEYMPKYFRGDSRRLDYALRALITGSAVFGESVPAITFSIKERTAARMSIQFSVRVENSAVRSGGFLGVADYLASAGEMPLSSNGLGLAAILAEQMNGTLVVSSERGCCRTVSFIVPLRPEADGCIPAAASAGFDLVLEDTTVPPVSLKVLVAEDNMIQQTTLKHLLEDIDCQAILVGNGKEALEEFENGDFDVILMDILMPEMDGFEATRLIRERERITGGRIPVLAMTSYSLKAIQEKCVSAGMSGYISKPVSKNQLLETLQRLCMPQELSTQTEPVFSGFNALPILDTHTVLENFGYNLVLYRELIEMYQKDFAGYGNKLAEKLGGDDLKDILECAHTLKGMVSNIGGKRLTEISRQIQAMCLEETKPDSTVWAPIIKAQTAEINDALERLDWDALERFVAAKLTGQ